MFRVCVKLIIDSVVNLLLLVQLFYYPHTQAPS